MAGSEAQVAPIEIRQLFHLAGVSKRSLQLQKTIWGFDDIELLPLRFLVVVSKVGGHVFGAYDGGRMIGFCFAIPGLKPGGSPICTATCWACCRSIATPASAAASSSASAKTPWRAAST